MTASDASPGSHLNRCAWPQHLHERADGCQWSAIIPRAKVRFSREGPMTSRTEKLRRRQHRKDKKSRRAPHQGAEFAPSGDLLVVNPPGAAKMSEALHALVEPAWNRCQDE